MAALLELALTKLGIPAALLTAGILFGFWAGSQFEKTIHQAALSSQLAAQLKATEEVQKIAAKLTEDLNVSESEIHVIHDQIEKQVVKYVPKIQKVPSDCSLSADVVRMLNDAAEQKLRQASGRIDASDTPDPKALARSDITEQDLILKHNDLIGQYNAARAQCNALIEFELKTGDE